LLQSIQSFGQAVETTLIKYGRDVVEEQFVLNRLASAAIDTYTMIVVLSRATQALQSGLPSAHHQELMTKVWCDEVRIRICSEQQQLVQLYPTLDIIDLFPYVNVLFYCLSTAQ
jgi:very long chain acyl-CoA dehydrogenase